MLTESVAIRLTSLKSYEKLTPLGGSKLPLSLRRRSPSVSRRQTDNNDRA